MEDFQTPALLSQYGTFFSPSMGAFRPHSEVEWNLIEKTENVAGSSREVADVGWSPAWVEAGYSCKE